MDNKGTDISELEKRLFILESGKNFKNLEKRIKRLERDLNCRNLEDRIKILENEIKYIKSAIQYLIKKKKFTD